MRFLVAMLALIVPGTAFAEAPSCTPPARLEVPHPDLPTDDQPRRVLPIGGYTLAMTWNPQYCRGRQGDGDAQCGGSGVRGFTLHGLWPDGTGERWPQYCRPAAPLPASVVRGNWCATPSAQLLQHEWAKHGTCMPGYSPVSYFRQSTGLYRALHVPDMDALSREPSLKARDLTAALARLNPGLPANAVRVTTTRDGWLDEVWLCLDRRFHYARCRPGSGGVTSDSDLRIWRGHR